MHMHDLKSTAQLAADRRPGCICIGRSPTPCHWCATAPRHTLVERIEDRPAVAGYAAAYPLYTARGWSPIKLPARIKFPPPSGFTGRDGADPSAADMAAWAEAEPGGTIALRLPADVIGIDVDCWGGKTGAATLAEAENRWGKLPHSPRSTSREDGSGIRLYRVPAGTVLPDGIEFPELGIAAVDIVQRHHRYVMSWPSIHPSGGLYRWLDDDDQPTGIPRRNELPTLPDAWLAGLTAPRRPPQPTAAAEVATAGHNPRYTEAAIAAELATLAGSTEGRRNSTLNVCALKCFSFVHGGHADGRAVWCALRDTALAIGLTLNEIEGHSGQHGTLGSAWRAAEPRDVPQPGIAL